MKASKSFFVLIISLFIIISCKTSKSEVVNTVEKYFSENLNIPIKNNHLYVIFSTKSCHSCIGDIIKYLNKNPKKDVSIIFSGYSKKNFSKTVQKINNNIELIYDLKESKFSITYLTSAQSVIFISSKNSTFLQFDYSNIESAIKMIEKFNN